MEFAGKQVFSLIISPDSTIKLNHRAKNKQYTSDEELCHKDGFVVIRVILDYKTIPTMPNKYPKKSRNTTLNFNLGSLE